MTDTRPLQTVYLIGFPEPDEPPGRVERLQKAFGIDEAMARHFLENMPVAVKRKANPDEARSYAEVLKKLGARVQIAADASTGQMARIVDEPSSALPTANVPGSRTSPGKPSRRSTSSQQAKKPERRESAFSPNRLVSPTQEREEGDGLSFWESLGVAMKAPFIGSGILWLFLLPTVLLFAVCMVSVPCLPVQIIVGLTLWALYMNMLGIYFAKSVNQGMCGYPRAPEISRLSDMFTEFRLRGLPLTFLSFILFFGASFLGNAVMGIGTQDEEVRQWDPSEKFIGEQGEVVVIRVGSTPQEVRDSEGQKVRVDPRKGTVTTLNTDKKKKEEDNPVLLLVAFFFALVIPLLYWPMALTVAGLSDSLINIFNPAIVGKGILTGGVKYLAVAGVGALIFGVGLLLFLVMSMGTEEAQAATKISVGLATLLLPLVIINYVSGVQAHLIGRILTDDPEGFEELVG